MNNLAANVVQQPNGPDLQKELDGLSGKLKAKLVVDALEGARKSGGKPNAVRSDLAKQNNVSAALFQAILGEFRTQLDMKSAIKQKAKSKRKPQVQGRTTRQSSSQLVPKPNYARSLNHENPVISATIIAHLPTKKAVAILQEMRPDRSQRAALFLACIEVNNHKTPPKTQNILRDICEDLPSAT